MSAALTDDELRAHPDIMQNVMMYFQDFLKSDSGKKYSNPSYTSFSSHFSSQEMQTFQQITKSDYYNWLHLTDEIMTGQYGQVIFSRLVTYEYVTNFRCYLSGIANRLVLLHNVFDAGEKEVVKNTLDQKIRASNNDYIDWLDKYCDNITGDIQKFADEYKNNHQAQLSALKPLYYVK